MAVDIYEALKRIKESNISLKTEIVPIEDSLDRVNAEDLFAKLFLPRFNNSAMDGFAILYKDRDKTLEITDTIFAGDNNKKSLKSGTAFKIMTGARIPKNCDAVIPKEDTKKIDKNSFKIIKDVREFQHIRYVGEDIKNGELLIPKGKEINFADITLLSSQGLSHIKVYKKPEIAVFSSGEELKLHYEKVEEYQIYNSNTPTLIARAKELGCDVTFMGCAKDNLDSIKEFITNSLGVDLIITSGGVSVGDADFTREAFDSLGFEEIFSGIIIKPGKPTIFGKIGSTYILNLPGNPLASALIFEFFGRVLLRKLLGCEDVNHNYIKTKLKEEIKNRGGRYTLVPGFFDGESFSPSKKRSPGMVSILASCNSMIILDKDIETFKKDGEVKIVPINWKFYTNEEKDFISK